MSDFGLTPEQRAILAILYGHRGHLVDIFAGVDGTVALRDLVERGLIYRAAGGGWWLTADGQAVVEAEE